MLEIRLLGGLDVRLDGRQVPPLSSARAESLLAYLLLQRDAPQPRQRIAFLLWPDSTEAQARTNLRHLLHKLLHALPDAGRFLDSGPRTLQWRPDAPAWLDVAEFEAALARGALADAVAAYGGDLLAGAYDEWVLEERERLRGLYLDALERLAREQRQVAYAEELARADPLREEAHRLLIELYNASGDRARALRAYHSCAATLERELGIQPSGATRALYDSLLPGTQAPEAVGRAAVVGRAREWEQLMAAWQESELGAAQLVLIEGEAGIGKTRLAEQIASFCAQRGAVVAEGRSYAAEGALAYGPVLEWLRELGTPRLPERAHRHELIEAVAEVLLSQPAPLLLIADDVQWADRESLQVIHYLLRTRSHARLMIAATARREERSEALDELVTALGVREQVREVGLQRLGREDTEALAVGLGAVAVPARLYEETEGNPLFVVEAIRAGAAMTPRVRAVVSSRMAHVSPAARDLLGVAATAGREFTAGVVGVAAGADEDALVRGLDELWRRGIVRAHGPDAYDFSHGKLRDAAYEQLSPAQRRRNHLRVADALERLGDPDTVSAQIANHCEQAGEPARSIHWFEHAAGVAMRMHASEDAVRWLTRAIELTDDPARELELLTALPAALMALDGYQSARTLATHERAWQILGDLSQEPAAPLLRSIALARLAQGDHEGAVAKAQELADRAARDRDSMLSVEADYLLGVTAFWQGDLTRSRRHLEAALDRLGPDVSAEHLRYYGTDPGVICGTRLALVSWLQGESAAAVGVCDAALERAARVDHPYSTATAHCFAGWLAAELGDLSRLRVHLAHIDARGGPPSTIFGEVLSVYLELREGMRPNLARAVRALAAAELAPAPGLEVIVGRLAVASFAAAGETARCLAATEQTLGRIGQSRVLEAEFRRARAECLLALGRTSEAADEYERALSVACAQGARALEERVRASRRNAGGTVAVASSET